MEHGIISSAVVFTGTNQILLNIIEHGSLYQIVELTGVTLPSLRWMVTEHGTKFQMVNLIGAIQA